MKLAGVLLAALAAIASFPLPSTAAGKTERPHLRWMISATHLDSMAKDPLAREFFGGTHSFVIVKKGKSLPEDWQSVPVTPYSSFAQLKLDLIGETINPAARAICYDNEAWQFTPLKEQRNPAKFEQLFAGLAHSNGLTYISTPGPDLAMVADAKTTGNIYNQYLELGLARDAARVADVVEIQAQNLESDLEKYTVFVSAATKQAREANAHIVVLAGLSTNPPGKAVSAEDLYRAVSGTEGIVDGYWLNIPTPGPYCPRCNPPRPDLALELMHLLAEKSKR